MGIGRSGTGPCKRQEKTDHRADGRSANRCYRKLPRSCREDRQEGSANNSDLRGGMVGVLAGSLADATGRRGACHPASRSIGERVEPSLTESTPNSYYERSWLG